MAQLFFMLMSIAVLAIMAVAGANYIQPGVNARIETRDKTLAAFEALSSAYRAYKLSNKTALPVASWATDIAPYAEKWSPGRLSSSGLTYADDATYGHYFCYTGNAVTEADHAGLLEIPAQFPVDTTATPNQKVVVVSYNACGKRSDDTLGSPPASWPATVYVTFWLDYANAI